jgi:protein SCO1/2
MSRGTALALAVALLGVAALVWRSSPAERPPVDDPRAVATYGDLALQTATGPLALSDLRGQVVVVYFGYTSCPDICPTTLQTMAAAFHALTEAEQAQAALLFVSVDPERDALDRLATYAEYFHPRFRAGSESPELVRRMAADWGVQYRRAEAPGSAMAYTVDHTTQSFLVDREGGLVREIPHGTPSATVADWLRQALQEAP